MQYRINAKGKSRNGLSFTSKTLKVNTFLDRKFKKEVMEPLRKFFKFGSMSKEAFKYVRVESQS